MKPIRFHPEAEAEMVSASVMHLHRDPGYWKSRVP